MTQDLYMLPPTILPYEQMDTPDLRYINSDIAPVKQPFKDTLDIESYNTHWYENEHPSRVPTFIRDSHMPSVSPLTTAPLLNNLKWDTDKSEGVKKMDRLIKTLPPRPTQKYVPILPSTQVSDITEINNTVEPESSETVHSPQQILMLASIAESEHGLFFVQYTKPGNMSPRWFVVQVEKDNSQNQIGGEDYFCSYLQRHPNDNGKGDDLARWWPEWRKIEWNENKTFEYGERILFALRARPDLKKFIKFNTDINLLDDNVKILGPFNFDTPVRITKTSLIIPRNAWEELMEKCEEFGILPPALSNHRKTLYTNTSTMRAKLGKNHTAHSHSSVSSLNFTMHALRK